MADNRYNTILEALQAAEKKKFLNRFIVKDGFICCLETDEIFSAADLSITEFHRMEGASDPDESAIIYFVETNTGLRGTLTDAYGAYGNPELSEIIKKIPITHENPGGHFENIKCSNCGVELKGPYCYACGQRDDHLHEPFYKLLWEAFTDYWHFDSKFVNTLAPLIVRPGFLTREFIEGRRIRYVHPIRLYFFLSVIFFLIFLSLASRQINSDSKKFSPFTDLHENVFDSVEQLSGKNEEAVINNLKISPAAKKVISAPNSSALKTIDSLNRYSSDPDSFPNNIQISGLKLPGSIELYEDSINKLPADKRPSSLTQWLARSVIRINQMPKDELLKSMAETTSHNLPKLMFILLPIFALILKLIYTRRKVYLIDHGIFTLHFHAFVFLVMSIILITYLLTGWSLGFGWMMLMIITYLFIAMKNVYRQSFFKTFMKLFSLCFIYFMVSIFVAMAYLIVVILNSVD